MSASSLKKTNLFSATLLVAGCCIGAGMIGLPVVSAMAGFVPSTLAMLLCYFFATSTGLLLVEATLWFDTKVNLITMAKFALGKTGKILTYALFLFLFYCLFVAYIDGGGQMFASILSGITGFQVPREIGILTCVAFVGTSVYAGINAVAGLNRVLILCIAISYCVLILLGLPHVQLENLSYMNFGATLITIPILLVCFGFQNLVPTLVHYVKRDVVTVRRAILIGNMIPFAVYLLWNFVILGILPDAGTINFTQVDNQGNMVTDLLKKTSESPAVILAANAFTFFAILTPFITNTLTFVDFLKDGLKTKSNLLIYSMVLLPPMALTFIHPHLFLKALGLVGGFADVLLFGALPVGIVAVGRYVKKMKGPYQVAGGKPFLAFIFILSMALLLLTKLA